ncbi:hypothetical protein BDZ89DRAFT_374961 [Hymenopellis radicata]|nr:hypothetical protein BDZ89DRAFT_374961 [Hymenopellis radicata]
MHELHRRLCSAFGLKKPILRRTEALTSAWSFAIFFPLGLVWISRLQEQNTTLLCFLLDNDPTLQTRHVENVESVQIDGLNMLILSEGKRNVEEILCVAQVY